MFFYFKDAFHNFFSSQTARMVMEIIPLGKQEISEQKLDFYCLAIYCFYSFYPDELVATSQQKSSFFAEPGCVSNLQEIELLTMLRRIYI